MVVPASGIAGLLKRVVGDRIEQRRKAVRAALRALNEGKPSAELLSADPAFTPTGRKPGSEQSASGVSVVSGPSAPGGAGFPNAPAELASGPLSARSIAAARRSSSAAWGYAIGLAGIAIAILVLLLFRR